MNSQIQQQFMELPDQIPFKKIIVFKVYDVQLLQQNNQFKFHIYKKCENMPDEKDGYEIVRKIGDFQWLVYRIDKESPNNLIIPAIPTNISGYYWDKLKNLTNNFYKNQKAEIKRGQEKKFICRSFKRFLEIIGDVSLKNLYKMPGFIESSFFTFLDQKFDIYKTQAFQKNEQTLKDKLSTTLGSSGKLFTQLMGIWKKKQSKYYLDQSIKNLNILEQQFNGFLGQLQKYEHSLAELCTNFLSQKENLQKKNLLIYHIYCRAEYIVKLLSMIKCEIEGVIGRVESNQHGLQQKEVRQQIQKYSSFISRDEEYLRKQFMSILRQFYRISINMPVELKISDICTSK